MPVVGNDRVVEAIVDAVFALAPFGDATRHRAALCLIDALGCALGAVGSPGCGRLLGPLVPGTTVPQGARVPGRAVAMDPMKAAFDTTVLLRWLDLNDTLPAGGHGSENLGAILAVADHCSRQSRALGRTPLRMEAVLRAMVVAYEIQGALAEANRVGQSEIGFDRVAGVKLASTAVAVWLMGGTPAQAASALLEALLDGGAGEAAWPDGGQKAWASADAAGRAVLLAWLAMRGVPGGRPAVGTPVRGMPGFTASPLRLERSLGSHFIDSAVLKLLPCRRSAATAVEAALRLAPFFAAHADQVAAVEVETHDEAMRRIVVTGTLATPEARNHCLQYMLAVTLLKGRLTIDDYADAAAADPAIDALRARMRIWENPAFTAAHRDPGSPTAANAVRLLLDDGTVSPREEVQIPIGDPRRSDEAAPLLRAKFHDLAGQAWSPARRERVLVLLDDVERLAAMDADVFMDQISG